MGYACPECHGTLTRKFSVVYAEGHHQIHTKSRGVGVGVSGIFRPRLGVGFGGARTRGVQQSELSRSTEPPAPASLMGPFKWGLGAGLVVVLVAAINNWPVPRVTGVLILDGIGVAIGVYTALQYNKTEWPPLHAAWDRQFLCTECGHAFVPAERDAAEA